MIKESMRTFIIKLKYKILTIILWTIGITMLIPFQKTQANQQILVSIVEAIDAFKDQHTRLAPSHFGHPGYQSLAFVYDKAVDAMLFKALGKEKQAKEILDYFSKKLRLPFDQIKQQADVHGAWGIVKIYPFSQQENAVGFVNALDVQSKELSGKASREYCITPGPIAFLAMAFLYVDRKEYLSDAIKMGEVLLLMQTQDGALIDGDRNEGYIYTEPHMNAFSVFLMLYEQTKQERWKLAAEKAWRWFKEHLYDEEKNEIDQGVVLGQSSRIFATDAYSWTMAGPAGDFLSLESLEMLTDKMLKRSLSKISLELPDGRMRTLILSDFTDATDEKVINARGGLHPLGSVEWSAGVILSLQKNAVRFWQEGSEENRFKASFYKGIAQYLTQQVLDSFYQVPSIKGLMSFYATGQWMATGHGWKTPYYYVKDPKGTAVISAGSSIAGWIVLPLTYQNPFILNDKYGEIYEMIELSFDIQQKAVSYIGNVTEHKIFFEEVPQAMSDEIDEGLTLSDYNQKMFLAFEARDYLQMQHWAEKVLTNQQWLSLAYQQQQYKQRDVGGLVEYPWGIRPSEALVSSQMIWKYPLLNEVGTAMWGMITASFLLNQKDVAKQWMRSMIQTVAYHQIFTPDGPGYWNALVSWERNPIGSFLDQQLGVLYREVLKELSMKSAEPPLKRIK